MALLTKTFAEIATLKYAQYLVTGGWTGDKRPCGVCGKHVSRGFALRIWAVAAKTARVSCCSRACARVRITELLLESASFTTEELESALTAAYLREHP